MVLQPTNWSFRWLDLKKIINFPSHFRGVKIDVAQNVWNHHKVVGFVWFCCANPLGGPICASWNHVSGHQNPTAGHPQENHHLERQTTSCLWLFQLDDSKSLHKKMVVFTKHPFKTGCLGYQADFPLVRVEELYWIVFSQKVSEKKTVERPGVEDPKKTRNHWRLSADP